MPMTRSEFETKMTDVIGYYGVQHFSRPLIDEIFRSFERFDPDRFQDVIRIVYRDVPFPPKAAHFFAAGDTLRREGAAHIALQELPINYDAFFPDQTWIDLETCKLLNEGMKYDPLKLRETMMQLVKTMRVLYEGQKKVAETRISAPRYSPKQGKWV